MWTGSFWKAAVERAIKTLAQTMLSLWLVGDQMLNAFVVDWGSAFGVGLGALIVSFLTSLVSAPVGPDASPSLVGEGNAGRHTL